MRIILNVDFLQEKDEERIAAYIEAAVGHWGGSFTPDDGLFPDNIKVKSITIKNQKYICGEE